MSVLVVSIAHTTASLDIIAKATMSEAECAALAHRLLATGTVSESLVLSTCNRSEIYVRTRAFHPAISAIADALAERLGVTPEGVLALCTIHWEDDAVVHAFNLAAGLDSLVIGESQVLGQVRGALTNAQLTRTAGPRLNELMQQALRVGKLVQSTTAIGGAGRSVLSSALEQLDAHEIRIEGRRCLVVGAGAMAGLAARALAARGAHIVCVNRTYEKAVRLAEQVGGRAARLADLREELADADIVVTCTGSRMISPATLSERIPSAIVDLAMPPDVDQAVDRHTLLVNLATIQASQEETGLAGDELAEARRLVADEVRAFLVAQRADAVTPTVIALRSKAEAIVDGELARLRKRLPDADENTLAELAQSLNRVAHKIVHTPTVRVREATDVPQDYAAALRTLFALDADISAPHASASAAVLPAARGIDA